MDLHEQVTDAFATIISNILNKPKEEIQSNLDAKLKEDFNMTSLQYFPLISGLEEKFDIEVDYAGFLTKALTVNDGIDFILAMVKDN